MPTYILYLNLFVIFNLTLIVVSILACNKKNFKTNFLFSVFFLLSLNTCVTNLAVFYFHNSAIVFTQISFVGFNLTMGPVLFQYVYSLTEQKISKRWFWHYIPCILVFVYGLSYIFLSNNKQELYLSEILAGNHLPALLLNFLMFLHTIVYFTWVKLDLKKIIFDILNKNYDQLILKKKWANDFINYLIGCNVIVIIGYSSLVFGLGISQVMGDLVLLPIIILAIYYFILFKNSQFNAVYEQVTLNPVHQESIKIINTQDNPILIELNNQLEVYLANSKAYTNPNLGLQILADALEVSPTLLSQTINQHKGISFIEYINYLRVEEAKTLLLMADKQHLKVDAIGEMAGFNSRSTFFSVFKKQTGITPTAFKNAVN